MNNNCEHFGNELDAMVERFRQEYDMTYAEMVGVLEMKKWLLLREAAEIEEEE